MLRRVETLHSRLNFVLSALYFSKPGLSSQGAIQGSDLLFSQVRDTVKGQFTKNLSRTDFIHRDVFTQTLEPHHQNRVDMYKTPQISVSSFCDLYIVCVCVM